MKPSRIFHISAASMLALLTACGGGGGGGTASVSLSGTAGKGLLIGADVKAYEVVGGKQSTTPWATTTTNNVGAYELKGSPSSNPIVVVVSAKTGTEMLDESQPQADGNFKKVPVSNLVLRSFVEKLTSNDTVQVNPLTESAVAMASNAKDSSGGALGLTANGLLAAKQFALQIAPDGVNPFAATLPATKEDLKDEAVAKMAVMMAGLISSVSNTCDLKCQVEALTKDVQLTVSAEGKGTIPSSTATALSQTKVSLLTTGQATLTSQSSVLGTVATNTLSTAASSAISAAQNTPIAVSTLTSAAYSDLNGVKGFVQTLRESFKTTETKLKTAQESLDSKYQKLTLQGLEQLSGAVNLALSHCVQENNFACAKPNGSTTDVTWTKVGDGWKGTGKSSDGYSIEGIVSGTVSNTAVSFSMTNLTVKNGSKTLVEMSSLTASGTATKTDAKNNEVTAGILNLAGSVKAYDTTPGSDLTITLGLTDAQANFDDTLQSFGIKGSLSLASNKSDSLTGSLEISGVKQTLTRTWGNTSYPYTEEFIKSAAIKLKATENSQGEVLAMDINGTRSLLDMSKARSTSNPETFDVTVNLSLSNNTKFSMNVAKLSATTLNQSVDLQSGTSKLRLSGSFADAGSYSADKWCTDEDGKILCASTLSLSVNGGEYTGIVKKSGGTVTADLYKGSGTSGSKIGVITNKGMIEIDGQSHSLY